MTTNQECQEEQDTSNVNIDAILAKRGEIAVPWSIEDVQGIRPDLTTEQAWEVLVMVKHEHDAEYGISWTTLEIWADMLFPKPAQSDKTEERP